MRLRIERTVPFPRDDVYAWWTDFREDDHLASESPARSVRALVRRDGDEVWLRDRATKPVRIIIEERVTLDPPSGYRVQWRYPAADVELRYDFDPLADGTRVAVTSDVRPRHIGHLVLFFLRRWARRYIERDTDFHLRTMARDLTSALGRGPLR